VDLQTLQGWLLGFGVLDEGRIDAPAQVLCLNLAQRRLCRRHRSSLNAVTDTIALPAAAASVAFPSSLTAVRRIQYLSPTTGKVVRIVYDPDLDRFRAAYPTGTTPGEPANFTFWGRSLLVGPPSASDLSLTCDFWRVFADLVNPGDTNALVDHVGELVVFTALAEFVPVWVVEDQRIPTWRATRDGLLDDFMQEEADRESAPEDGVMEAPG
jgi:hypothetical protein